MWVLAGQCRFRPVIRVDAGCSARQSYSPHFRLGPEADRLGWATFDAYDDGADSVRRGLLAAKFPFQMHARHHPCGGLNAGACMCVRSHQWISGSRYGLDPHRAATLGKGYVSGPWGSFIAIRIHRAVKPMLRCDSDVPHIVGLPGLTAGPVWHQVHENQGGTGKMIGRCSYCVVWSSKHRSNVGRWWFPAKGKPEIRYAEGVAIAIGKPTSHGGRSSAPASARTLAASSHDWPVVARWRTRC